MSGENKCNQQTVMEATDRNVKQRERYQNNKEKYKQRNKQNYEKHKDAHNKKASEYYLTHKEEIQKQKIMYNAKKKQEYLEKIKDPSSKDTCSRCDQQKPLSEFEPGKRYCRPCGRQMCKNYKNSNKEDVSEYNKQYKAENKDTVREYNRKYTATARKTNIQFKIKMNLRIRLSKLIKKANATKYNNTLNFLGCSLEFLLVWFESRFLQNMTFQNYGKVWHIDHVIPCAMFDLTNEEDQKRCFHWSNLQPMNGLQNILKKDKTDRAEIMNQLITTYDTVIKNKHKYANQYTLIDYNRFEYL